MLPSSHINRGGNPVAADQQALRGKRSLLALVTLAASLAALAPAPDAPATTSSRRRIPIRSVADVLVDRSNRLIFVSGGLGTKKVLALDLSGGVVKTFRRTPDATAMVQHRNRVYVLLARRGAIQVLNAKTLRKVGRHRAGRFADPFQLVKSGGRLWFAAGYCSDSQLRSFDLHTHRRRTYRVAGWGCPGLAATERYPGRFFAWERTDVTSAYKVDVRSGAPKIRLSHGSIGDPDSKLDMAVHPNGRALFAIEKEELERFRVRDLGKTARYPLDRFYPLGLRVEATRRGPLAAATTLNGFNVWKPNRNPPLVQHRVDGPNNIVYPRGLAIHPSGRRVLLFTGLLKDRSYVHSVRFGR